MKAEIKEDGIHITVETWAESHAIQKLLPIPSNQCPVCFSNIDWLRAITIHTKPGVDPAP